MAGIEWVDKPSLRDPVALVAFEGWGDAGESSTDAVRCFVERLESTLIAVIDPDDHFDFQVRRPVVSLDPNGIRAVSWPRNEIHAVLGTQRDIVVVLGEEPHYRWKRFTADLVEALAILGVQHVITLGAFVGQVAHTLPVPLIGSATKPDALSLHGLLPSGYEGPTGIVGVLNHYLGAAGIDVVSVWAAVPHYLSNQEYPPGTEALAIKAAEIAGVSLDIGTLATASREYLSTVDAAIEGNADLEAYVKQLEEDAADDDTGERLVDEIERYLRHH